MSIAFEPELDEISTGDSSCQELKPGEVVALRLPSSVRLKINPKEFALLAGLNRELRLEMTAGGELIAMPPTSTESGGFNQQVSGYLFIWAISNGLGRSYDSSTGYILPNGACRSPDASWISADRWNALSDAEKTGFAHICPDFVVELRSPNDSIESLKLKMEEYRDNGARLGWLIDPIAKTVIVYRPGQEPETLVNPLKISGEAVLPGFILDLACVFTPIA